jgi:succinoglycan biosynthesis protein ExoA
MLPMISVVVPVRNERTMLPKLIDQLLKQNYPVDRFEVLLVDGRSTDGTADLVQRRYTQKRVKVRVLDNPKMRASAGRNIGICAAAGDVIVFIDGHCTIPSKNLLEDTAAILRQTGAGCLVRPQPLLGPALTPTGEAIAQAWASWLGRAQDAKTCDLQRIGFVETAGVGAAYPREVFARVGFYDESFDACEDAEFQTRVGKAGIRAYTDPRLAVYDRPRKNVRRLFQQMVQNGRGRIRLMRKYPESGSKRQLAPLAILAVVALTALAWTLLPRGAAEMAAIPLGLMMAAVLATSVQVGIRHGLISAWRAPRIFAAIYCGLGVGLLMEALTPEKTAAAPPTLEVLRPRPELQMAEEVDRAA